ncbi:hypothetical protein Tco_1496240, partial [Tanacetum coccineum]
DFPDREDSRARSIHKSFTSSASFWESRTLISAKLKGLKGQKEAKSVKNRQGTKETRKKVKKQPKIKTGSADTARKAVKGQNNEAKDLK